MLKAYFATLGDSAHPEASDSRVRQITKFQELCESSSSPPSIAKHRLTWPLSPVVVAFREFASITDETIASERKRFRAEVVISIETFAKRSAIRNLRDTGRLDKEQLGLVYDHFQLAALRSKEGTRRPSAADVLAQGRRSSATASPRTPSSASFTTGSKEPKEEEKVEERIDRRAFGKLLGEIASWARDEKLVKNGFHEHIERQPVDHELIDRIFVLWDQSLAGALSFQVCCEAELRSMSERVRQRGADATLIAGHRLRHRLGTLQRLDVKLGVAVYRSRQQSRRLSHQGRSAAGLGVSSRASRALRAISIPR